LAATANPHHLVFEKNWCGFPEGRRIWAENSVQRLLLGTQAPHFAMHSLHFAMQSFHFASQIRFGRHLV